MPNTSYLCIQSVNAKSKSLETQRQIVSAYLSVRAMHLSRLSRRGNDRQVNSSRNDQTSSFLSTATVPSDSTGIQQTPGSSRTLFHPYRRKSVHSHIRKKPRQKGIWIQNLNLVGFKPGDVEIKTKSRGVTVHAKSREESCDGTIYLADVSRNLTLPEDVKATDVRCIYSENGRLTLKAPVRYHAQQDINGTNIILQLL